RSYTTVLNLLFGRMIRYYNGLTIYPTEFLAQGPLETHGFGFQAEALLKAVASGYSFLEITLPVDTKNLPLSRSITVANIADATMQFVRLVREFSVVGRPTPRLLKVSAPPIVGQGADEIGVSDLGQTTAGEQGHAASRGPLRILISGGSSGIGAAIAHSLA